MHGGRHGIRRLHNGELSLLLDYGLSSYQNFWEDHLGTPLLHYLGEGQNGNQELQGGNLILLEALQNKIPARVWERVKPNVWFDLGHFKIKAVTQEVREERTIFVFQLEPHGNILGNI